MQSLDIRAFTYEQRCGLLPDLTVAFCDCGGWVLERKALSPTNMEFRVEIQLRAVLEIYAAILANGVELTRSGHDALTELCTRCKHVQHTLALDQVIAIRLEINFLEDVTQHSPVSSGSGVA